MELSFVDTSAWVSAADSAELSHVRVANTLRDRQGRLLTADHVLQETWMVMKYRHNRFVAEALVNKIRGGVARVEVSLLSDLAVASEIGTVFSDQDFSLSDRTSWAVMMRLGITEVVTLDHDFRLYRYGSKRHKAFDVVP